MLTRIDRNEESAEGGSLMPGRMTRLQWLAHFFDITAPAVRRSRPEATGRHPLRYWSVQLPDGRRVTAIHARTQSEAKARAKRVLNLPGRIPIGSTITPDV